MVHEYWLDGERRISWYQWKAEMLNRLFREYGRTGEAGKITAATVLHGERQPPANPEPGISPIGEWGNDCARGWVRDERFGPGQVIKGTNRNSTRKIYRAKAKAGSSLGQEPPAGGSPQAE